MWKHLISNFIKSNVIFIRWVFKKRLIQKSSMRYMNHLLRTVRNQRSRIQLYRLTDIIILLPFVPRRFCLKKRYYATNRRNKQPSHFSLETKCRITAQTKPTYDCSMQFISLLYDPSQHSFNIVLVIAELFLTLTISSVIIS